MVNTSFSQTNQSSVSIRPPAVPLVTCDPYFSIWSRGDKLTDVPTSHWTGTLHRLTSTITIDQKAFRLMGSEPAEMSALPQTKLTVLPTRTIYTFAGNGVEVELTFLTPSLPHDIDLLSQPVTFISWKYRSTDSKAHKLNISFDAHPEISVDEANQTVTETVTTTKLLECIKSGTVEQPILRKVGDGRRIDWGYLYVAFPNKGSVNKGLLSQKSFPSSTRKVTTSHLLQDRGSHELTSSSRWKSVHAIIAYDDEFSIQYFGQNLKPYWKRNGKTVTQLLDESEKNYVNLESQCAEFDAEIMDDLRNSGGEKYAQMCALAFRQCFAGNKIAADKNGQPILFPKENTSNGCIGTVDVIFPMAPQFLLFGPSLTKAMIVSNLDYGSSSRWKWPFAPHDLGTYPKANGQVYGGGERTEENQMPVEETGNMLILTAALAEMEGNASFAKMYWPTLTKWAEFLKAKGFDPENQLSTDDFMGHMAHQTNLSIKAILGLASYGRLCQFQGLNKEAKEYTDLAKSFAVRWEKEANDGDHYRLAFDQEGSWGQKYNLVWDQILGLNIFPTIVKQKEMAFYRKMLSPYGLALDSRQKAQPSKIDWTLWTATLTENRDDFNLLVDACYRFVNESPQRNGVGDLYNCVTGNHIGMHSRPVVGGFFLKLLYDKKLHSKWSARDRTKASNWAPLPTRPEYVDVIPSSQKAPQSWLYTLLRPDSNWFKTDFNSTNWKSGLGPFAGANTPGVRIGTEWSSSDIWMRKEFIISGNTNDLLLSVYHDEDVEIFINGKLVAKESGYVTEYNTIIPLTDAFIQGKNVIAVHCRQTSGGQGVDVGIVRKK